MAEVYLGIAPEQIAPERLVAVKRILPNVSENREFVQMFLDEAKITGQLHHPNIGQIFDVGDHHGTFYIAMEYISGHDLRVIWDRERAQSGGGLPIPIAVSIVQKICAGLDYAHRKVGPRGESLGIIHRDVSPQNILMSYDGELKVIDFGIAKAANRTVRTQTGILKGKFAYMSPEQALGKKLDHRSDIFAIGVILHELLTGTRTFRGANDFELIEKVRKAEFVPPSEINPSVPKALEKIVYKALAERAEERYRWASEMEVDLDAFAVEYDQIATKNDLRKYIRHRFPDEVEEENTRLKDYAQLFQPRHRTIASTSSQARFLSDELGHEESEISRRSNPEQQLGTVVDNSFEGSDVETNAFDSEAAETQIRHEPEQSEELEQTRSGFSKPHADGQFAEVQHTNTEELKSRAFQLNKWRLPTNLNPKVLGGIGVGLVFLIGLWALFSGGESGWLIATTEPGLRLEKSGRVLCASTPCRIPEVDVPYLFDIVHDGTVVQTVTLEEAPEDVLVVDVKLMSGRIDIKTKPEGATVTIGEEVLSKPSPTDIEQMVAEKAYNVKVEKKGYAPLTTVWISPKAGERGLIDLSLTSLSGTETSWRIKSEPGDASVLLENGRVLSALNDKVIVKKEKPMGVWISRPGCEAVVHTLEAIAETKSHLSTTLKCESFDSALRIRAVGKSHIKIDGVPLAGTWKSLTYWLPAGEHLVEVIGQRTSTRHLVTTNKKRKTLIRSKAK